MIVVRNKRQKPRKSSVRITDPHAEILTQGRLELKQNSHTLDSEVLSLKITVILQKNLQFKFVIILFIFLNLYSRKVYIFNDFQTLTLITNTLSM